MEQDAGKKVIQAVHKFLEAVHGKQDPQAVSEVVQEMIDELLKTSVKNRDGIKADKNIPWKKLDHFLRSPMNGILGFSEILLEEIKDPELRWKIEQINESAHKIMDVLDKNMVYGFEHEYAGAKGELPQSLQEKPPSKEEMSMRKPPKSAGKKHPKVLIVEDNTVNSNLLMHHIRKQYQLFFSTSGKAAVELTRDEKVDAVLMDINLGQGIDGTEAMLQIRRQSGNEKLPIVAVTGYATSDDRDFFMQAGFDEFIAKPFEKHQILDILERILRK